MVVNVSWHTFAKKIPGLKEKMHDPSVTTETIIKRYGMLGRWQCWFEEKFEEKVREKGLKLLSAKEGEKILEIGMGTGCALAEIARAVGNHGKVYGTDIAPKMIELSRKRLERLSLLDRAEIKKQDARNLAFNDGLFDGVYTVGTLDMFDPKEIFKVLREIKRVLKPQGRLVGGSLSKDTQKGQTFYKSYEWMHRVFPGQVVCRAIPLEEFLKEAGFEIKKTEDILVQGLFPMRMVKAKPI